MTLRTIFATTAICGFIALAGCSAKESVKIDTTPSSAASAMNNPAPAPVIAMSGSGEKGSGNSGDGINAADAPKAVSAVQQTNNVDAKTCLDPIYFNFDSHLLSAESRETLSNHARWLDKNRKSRIIIEGHTDERGADAYNLALGEKRAFAAKRYIEILGITSDRMETISYGEEKPAVNSHDEAAWSKNRRVEFVIIK